MCRTTPGLSTRGGAPRKVGSVGAAITYPAMATEHRGQGNAAFITPSAHGPQQQECWQGWNRVARGRSKHTTHSRSLYGDPTAAALAAGLLPADAIAFD